MPIRESGPRMSDSLAVMTRTSDQATMLRLVLGALGLGSLSTATAAGCGSGVVIDSSDGGGAGSTTTGTAGGTTTGTAGTGGTTTTVTGTGGTGACTAPIKQADIDVPATGPCSNYYNAVYVCFPSPKPPAVCDDVYSKACVLDAYECGLQSTGDQACGPDPAVPDACCYTVVGDCPVGRPFLIDGHARLSTLVPREGWADSIKPDTASLDGVTRAALADFWGREALFEHASVASFARFVMQLLAAGAPADLVRSAQRAVAEEIDHATLCFGLASAYSGSPTGPSPLDLTGAFAAGQGAIDIAVAVAREGCIAETVSALQVAAARDAATDPAIRSALATVAEQEMEHAALAWRYLRWAMDHGDAALHAAVASVFKSPEIHVGIGPVPAAPGDPEAMRAHGCLPPDERRSLAADSLARVVVPAAWALLQSAQYCAQQPPLMSHERSEPVQVPSITLSA